MSKEFKIEPEMQAALDSVNCRECDIRDASGPRMIWKATEAMPQDVRSILKGIGADLVLTDEGNWYAEYPRQFDSVRLTEAKVTEWFDRNVK